MINLETNHRDQATDEPLNRTHNRYITSLKMELAELDGEIGQAIKASPAYCET